jgi:hypothetical protein
MHLFHRPPHEVPTSRASSGPLLRVVGLSKVTRSTSITHISENHVFILGLILDLLIAPRSVRLRMNVVEARRHRILRRRNPIQYHGHLLQTPFRQRMTEICVLDLLQQRLGFDIRKERRPRNPVNDQLAALRAPRVGSQKLGEEVFEQHLLVATGEVGYHQVDHFVAEILVLQDCCSDVEIAELEEELRCRERRVEGRKVARAVEPKRIASQSAARQSGANKKEANCDLAFAVE